MMRSLRVWHAFAGMMFLSGGALVYMAANPPVNFAVAGPFMLLTIAFTMITIWASVALD